MEATIRQPRAVRIFPDFHSKDMEWFHACETLFSNRFQNSRIDTGEAVKKGVQRASGAADKRYLAMGCCLW